MHVQSINLQSVDDQVLTQRYHEQEDQLAFNELYRRYAHLIYGACMKYLKDPVRSKEATQEICERIFKGLREQAVVHFKSWLFLIIKSVCLDRLRRNQNNFTQLQPLADDQPAVDLQPHWQTLEEPTEESWSYKFKLDDQRKEIDKPMVTTALKNLHRDQRRCLRAFYFQQKSYRDIAYETGFSLKEVKSLLQNGKRNLRMSLKSQLETSN